MKREEYLQWIWSLTFVGIMGLAYVFGFAYLSSSWSNEDLYFKMDRRMDELKKEVDRMAPRNEIMPSVFKGVKAAK